MTMTASTASTAAGMIADARTRIRNLTPNEVATAADEGALVVDLREPAERDAGTISGSLHVPRGMLEFRADAASPYHLDEFATDRRIILFCASGGRSALAADTLQRMGYTDVAHLDGGFKAWTESTEG